MSRAWARSIGVAQRIDVAVPVAHLALVAQRRPGAKHSRLEHLRWIALLMHHVLPALQSHEHRPCGGLKRHGPRAEAPSERVR